MQANILGEVDYIHPYGKGFMIYTDKEWSKGKVKLEGNTLILFDGEYLRIPVDYILSIDKSITLPAIREGRALLLVEYMSIKRRENIYLLLSAEERFIRRLRLEILKAITSKTRIMFRVDEKWYSGTMSVAVNSIAFSSLKSFTINIEDISNIERTKIEYGFKKIGVISIDFQQGKENKNIKVFVNPLKRMFFWQLITQVIDDYINTEIMANLSNLDRMIIHLLSKEWSYEDIMRKLELSEDEMASIVEKLAKYGIIRKIIILKLTDRGKKVITHISEGDLQ